jgi:hypothetical protein
MLPRTRRPQLVPELGRSLGLLDIRQRDLTVARNSLVFGKPTWTLDAVAGQTRRAYSPGSLHARRAAKVLGSASAVAI